MRALVALAVAASAVLACQTAPLCGSVPCPSKVAYLNYSPCGFKSISSTCSGFSVDGGPIRGAAGETCTVTVTFGEGTTATTKLTFREGDDCCPGVQLASQTPLIPPTGCVADAGADGSVDASADAVSDAPNETAIDP